MPDPPTLPTPDELARLPRLARLAFAAHCVRRAMLPPEGWRNAGHGDAVEAAVAAAERAAAGAGGLPAEIPGLAETAAFYRAALEFAEAAGNQFATLYCGVRYDLICAAQAVVAAAAGPAEAELAARAVRKACESLAAGGYLRHAGDVSRAHAEAVAPLRRAFEALREQMALRQWTDETPVPSEFFKQFQNPAC